MSTIMPQGELTRKAVVWIDERRQEEGAPTISKIIEEAAMQFNLGPKDVEFLTRFYKEQGED